MAKKENKENKEKKEKEVGLAPISRGGSGAVSAIGGLSQADRVAQVRAMQAMSPFAAVVSEINVNIEKDFQLSRDQFDYRTKALKTIDQKVSEIVKKNEKSFFNQHIENVTFREGNREKPKHSFLGDVNTKLFSPSEVLKRQGGTYVISENFKPPEKGTME